MGRRATRAGPGALPAAAAALAALALVAAAPVPAAAQVAPRNAVYVEALGPGFLYSVNYERILENRWAVRVGASAAPLDVFDYAAAFGTLAVLLGRGPHRIELGAGAGVVRVTDFLGVDEWKGSGAYGTVAAGYRHQPTGPGWCVRVTATPLFTGDAFQFWGGISLGRAF